MAKKKICQGKKKDIFFQRLDCIESKPALSMLLGKKPVSKTKNKSCEGGRKLICELSSSCSSVELERTAVGATLCYKRNSFPCFRGI